jgi:magnesium transporter
VTEPSTSTGWVTSIAPSASDGERLRARLGAASEVLDHALDRREHPRLRTIGDVTLIVLRVPVVAGSGETPYATSPLSLVMTPAGGLVIAPRDGDVARRLARFLDACEGGRARPALVLLEALELTADAYLAQLDAIEGQVDAIERRLARSLDNRGVFELLRYQKSLVYFSSALEAMHLMLERLEKTPSLFGLEDGDMESLADATVEFRQALETSNLQRSVMAETMEAFASIISNNLNSAMKILAAGAVVLTLPMVVASFYGMNVPLPGQESPRAFPAAVLFSLALCAVFLVVFRLRRWL